MRSDEADGPAEDSADEPDMWDCGCQEYPVRPDVLDSYLDSHPSVATAGAAGIARKATAIRKYEHTEQNILIVRDTGLVPDDGCCVFAPLQLL